MFIIREVREQDLEELYKLSEILKLASKVYFLNLPHDKIYLREKIELSIKSFSGNLNDHLLGEYIFVMEDLSANKIVGTSMIVTQHGTQISPHQFFRVKHIEKFSVSLHKGFIHEVLEYGYNSDGPTEIGGLVLDPNYRNHPDHLGKQLSFVRFLYIAMKKRLFKDEILAELQPPLTSSGKSHLWEAIGRKFTNLSYHEADQLSRNNKEFIISLFPEGYIYTCLLNKSARESIGRINPNTRPVEHMLKNIGFKYLSMIDPFDGGPHYGAKVKDIILIQNVKQYPIENAKESHLKQNGLLAVESKDGFLATQSHYEIWENKMLIPLSTLNLLKHPKTVSFIPL
ncbi:MAG: arginine N-succinyltransferase [Spirochaetota bacterium]|nr:arginine N-succinyltransferase [Spirochaetota bacterium]